MADTQTSHITIGGDFKGRLVVTGKVILLATGTCTGTIECREIEMEAGAVLNAEVTTGL